MNLQTNVIDYRVVTQTCVRDAVKNYSQKFMQDAPFVDCDSEKRKTLMSKVQLDDCVTTVQSIVRLILRATVRMRRMRRAKMEIDEERKMEIDEKRKSMNVCTSNDR
jgi:hypothetical protein